jgi:hypothetical protein
VITDAVLSIVFGLLDAITSLLPTFSAPFTYAGSSMSTAVGNAGHYLLYLDGWIDLPLWLTLLTAFATMWGVAVTVYGVLWVYHHMPGKGT